MESKEFFGKGYSEITFLADSINIEKNGFYFKFKTIETQHMRMTDTVLEIFSDGKERETYDILAFSNSHSESRIVGGYFQYILFNANGGQIWSKTYNLWQPSGPLKQVVENNYPDLIPIFSQIFKAQLVLSTKYVQ